MNTFRACLAVTLLFAAVPSTLAAGSDDEAAIRTLTDEFCAAVVSGDLSILDRTFDADPSNVFYDINEGPLVGLDRLKRVWQAATRNSRLNSFQFHDDLKIDVEGERALQTGTWTQSQIQADESTRQIEGRATILWTRKSGDWKVYHYHGSVTPRRGR
jgi:ketosteroid isomerase-like protein